jgi:glycosyltransferase involved in cell wall biosynthesis
MNAITAVLCTHNPRPDYLRRALDGLRHQTLTRDRWELLVVDNASDEKVADAFDLSWHARARHVREGTLGLTHARLRGIREASGELIVFVDDDNVLGPDYLERALEIHSRFPRLGAFGAGTLEPELEVDPEAEIRPYLTMMALRSVPRARWSNNPRDHESIPWGAGLCVSRAVVCIYARLVARLGITDVIDRRGTTLCAGGDDLFSWAAASATDGFGIFPQLRATHLVPASRLNQGYVLRLVQAHAFSHGILRYVLEGDPPRRIDWFCYVHWLMHGIRNGVFSMRCQRAMARGQDRASSFILDRAVEPLERNWAEEQTRRVHDGVGAAT